MRKMVCQFLFQATYPPQGKHRKFLHSWTSEIPNLVLLARGILSEHWSAIVQWKTWGQIAVELPTRMEQGWICADKDHYVKLPPCRITAQMFV
jgi:hypothetical protein